MDEKYGPVFRDLLRECPVCGAATSNPRLHSDWHDRLRDVVTNGIPMTRLEDMDQ